MIPRPHPTHVPQSGSPSTSTRRLPHWLRRGSVALLAVAGFAATPLHAASFTVTNTNDSGAWSLREVVATANANPDADTVTFDPALTVGGPASIVLTSGQLDLTSSVTIQGPGASSLTISGNSASRIFSVGSGATVTLSGLSLINGSVTISNGGGAIDNSGTLSISDCTLSGNSAGGDLFGDSGGGAIQNRGSLAISGSTLSGNSCNASGGAIQNFYGRTLTIDNTTLTSNTSGSPTTNSRGGGAIFNQGTLTIRSSTLSGNSVVRYGGGGAIGNQDGSVTISDSTLSGNSTNTDVNAGGGAIQSYGGGVVIKVINSTISGNTDLSSYAPRASAISDVYGALTVVQSTITGNSPAGVAVEGNVSGSGVLKNSIVAGNGATDLKINGTGMITTNGANFIGNPGAVTLPSTDKTFVSTGKTPAQVLNTTLANNGGPTRTHALVAGSPALDAAVNADALDASGGALTTDQRGSGYQRNAATVDLGAFEAQLTPEITIEQPVGTALSNTIVAWGSNEDGQTTVPGGLAGVQALAAGYNFNLALKGDGTVVAWGQNDSDQTNVPGGLTGVTAIAAGGYHALAVKSDGTVVAWGWNAVGQATVPGGLADVRAVAAGYAHSVGLKSDGTVVAWGSNDFGQATVPGGLSGVQAIAAGGEHTLALKSDGTVAAWGRNDSGQTNVPAGLTDVQAIASLGNFSVALKSDGSVVAWGDNTYGQTNVPLGLTDVQAIAAGGNHTVALRNDGTVIAWGYNDLGVTTVPEGLTGVQAIAAGNTHTVALVNPAVAFGDQSTGSTSAAKTFTIKNTGTADLTISQFGLGGADHPHFTLVAPETPFTVAPDATATFSVTFHPSTTGAKSVTLLVESDDADEGDTEITLTGTGTKKISAFTTGRQSVLIDVLGLQNVPTVAPTITILTQPSHGTATVVDGKVRFTPSGILPGNGDSFTYQTDDGDGGIVTGAVQIVNFTTAEGDYDGLISESQGTLRELIPVSGARAHERSGHLRLNVSAEGSFTGVLTFGGVEVRSAVRAGFRGVGRRNGFGSDGTETIEIKRPPQAPITIQLSYDTEEGTMTGSAESIDSDGEEFTSTFTLKPQVTDSKLEGTYTLLIASDDSEGTPMGTGFATVKIKGDGLVTYAGKLADGTTFNSGAWVHGDGSFAIYKELYRGTLAGRGSLRGEIGSSLLEGRSRNDGFGYLDWFKPGRARDTHFPEGFTVNRGAELCRYQKPARGTRVLDFAPGTDNGRFYVDHGDLEVDQMITLPENNLPYATTPNGAGVQLRFNLTSGFFTGHFRHPETGRRTPFAGAINQSGAYGAGYFLGQSPTDGCSVKLESGDR